MEKQNYSTKKKKQIPPLNRKTTVKSKAST